MVVVSFRRLIISLSLILITTLVLIAFGLEIIGGEKWYLQLGPQSFFFWGITVLIAQIWITGTLLYNHKKIMKTISRLSTIEDLNSMNAVKSFRDMGVLGDEIRKVLMQANQLSIMRADRISALNNLVNLICEGYSEPVIVTDVKGDIFSISEKLKSRILKETDGKMIKNILELKPDIKLSEVLSFIEIERTAWTDSESSGLVCTPVFDKNNTVQFCIWELETSFFAGKLKELNQQKSKIQPSYKKLREFINPLRRKKKSLT